MVWSIVFFFLLKVLWNHWVLWKENVEDKWLIIDFTVIKDMLGENVHSRGNYVSTYYWLLSKRGISTEKLRHWCLSQLICAFTNPSCEWYSWSISESNYWEEAIIFVTKPMYVWDSHLKYSSVLYIVVVGVRRQKFL